MYDTQRALIVPVLIDVTEAEVPLSLRNVSMVDYRRDPNYEHKLITMLRGLYCVLLYCAVCVCVCVCVLVRVRSYDNGRGGGA